MRIISSCRCSPRTIANALTNEGKNDLLLAGKVQCALKAFSSATPQRRDPAAESCHRIVKKSDLQPVTDPAAATAAVQQPTTLALIRHAEVEERYHGVFGGNIDMDLSPRGHEQAAALAQYLHRLKFSAVYASPMKRVQQTMRPFVVNGVPKPEIVPNLREVSFGDWTGLKWTEVQGRFGVSAWQWLQQLESRSIPNAEHAPELRARVEPCVREIVRNHPGEQVAIVCHGGVIRMILAILLDQPLSRMGAFQIEYASLTKVRLNREQVELELVNFTPWRDLAA
jgi:broad specificity phosphatase PhoE